MSTKYPDFEGHYEEPLAKHSPLWADQYAYTMAQAFFTNGKHDVNTTFHAYVRKNPFGGSYVLTGGQNILFEWLRDNWKLDERDLEVLRTEMVANPKTGEMERLFTDEFIEMVKNTPLQLTIDAMPEGELAFPDEPIYRVHGPLWQCLLVEAAILNVMNSQSLFATLASRIVEVTADDNSEKIKKVLELGLRRAQAIGGLEPTRGAFIGGIDGTSNMLAKKYYSIPSSGTMAHAFIMMHEHELEAFEDYAKAMPSNGIFLVDTYETLEGVRNAIRACQKHGVKMKGIRLDSGDLTYLSIEARKLLDEAGFTDALIAASNDLDEEKIKAMKAEGCQIDIWGLGTHLVTSKAQPALGGVYKLGAVFDGDLSQNEIDAIRKEAKAGAPLSNPDYVRDVIKMSGDAIKVTIPGELDVIRYIYNDASGHSRFDGDTIVAVASEEQLKDAPAGVNSPTGQVLARNIVSVRKEDDTFAKAFQEGTPAYRPLIRTFNEGQMVIPLETVHKARARAEEKLGMLEDSHKRLNNPHRYISGIEEGLYEKRHGMMRKLRMTHNAVTPR